VTLVTVTGGWVRDMIELWPFHEEIKVHSRPHQ
jgi:hypothetical protein